MCDGPYIAHVRDPGTAPPNLSRVQEIAAGMWRIGTSAVVDPAELWVDDIRLGDVVRETGAAGARGISPAAAGGAGPALRLSPRRGPVPPVDDHPSVGTAKSGPNYGALRGAP